MYACMYVGSVYTPVRLIKTLLMPIASPITFMRTHFVKTNVRHRARTQCRYCDHAVFTRPSAGVHVNSAWSSCLQIYNNTQTHRTAYDPFASWLVDCLHALPLRLFITAASGV